MVLKHGVPGLVAILAALCVNGPVLAQYQHLDDAPVPGSEAEAATPLPDATDTDPSPQAEDGADAADGEGAPRQPRTQAVTQAPETPGSAQQVAICETEVEAFMEDRAVLFASGSARLTSESETLLDGLAQILSQCSEAPVYVEGHTDSDGGDALNLVLSLSRAETVVDTLIDLGIAAERLYAVGYGAGLPIASNDTAAGKALNRRIVFRFEDSAEPVGDTLP